MAKKFIPYDNEADVLHIGGLMVENRLDRITLSGDIDLTLDKAGLAHARAARLAGRRAGQAGGAGLAG
jgi:hypothetical protein